MKFSVLLPTRNRLEYLRYAVESVLRQDERDWEIVISDNDSTDDIAGYVASLADPRIRYVRTESFVPVTENWNNALAYSSGDYVVMLGDDDALLPGYFTTLRGVIEHFDPDCVYTGALLFVYPNVLRETPSGYLQAYGYAAFLRGHAEPYLLPPEEARSIVRHSRNFRIRMGFNMQFTLVSRRMVDRLRRHGDFYQSPFPDYYATNALFLLAERIVALPRPCVLIGMTRKSYGFFHYRGQDEAAMAFLKGAPSPEVARALERVLLPGSNINNGWLLAMETLGHSLGALVPDINYRRYRHVQTMHMLQERYVTGNATDEQLAALKSALRPWERVVYGFIEHAAYRSGRRLAAAAKNLVFHTWRLLGRHFTATPTTYLPWFAEKIEGRYADAIEVFKGVDPDDPAWLS